jgi:hypothetical protein
MAIDITNNIPTTDYSDPSVDTVEKSLIKINSTSYNVFDNWSDLIQKYFGIDNSGNPYISTLKSSFFGYFNELASNEIKNAVYHKNFLYDEHFLNTAILPESVYNFAKIYNVPIDTATPSTMYLKMSISESSLTSSSMLKEVSLDTVTNADSNTLKVYTLTFTRDNTLFTISNYNFSLPYPIILTIQQISGSSDDDYSYSYTVNYDTTSESFPPAEEEGTLPYLKVWKENVDSVDYVYIGFQVYQFEKTTNEVTITTSESNPSSLYHTFTFDNQLAFFDARYEFNGVMTNLNLYFNNIYTPTEEEYYAYYTYLNDNTLQISFSSDSINGFVPTSGSTIYFRTYTTLGTAANFDYSGGVTMKFTNNSTYSYLDFTCETISDGASGGKDRLDIYGQKTKILERLTTRNNIITDNDLLKFFDSVNESLNINGSTIQFLKKQDDVIKRIYCNFLLLRDENERVLPTNTAPHLIIKADDLLSVGDTTSTSNGETKKTKLAIKEHSIVKCNYVRDVPNYNALKTDSDLVVDNFENYFDKTNNIRYSQDYIKYILDNNYFQNIIDQKKASYEIALDNLTSIYDIMQFFEVDSDELVYTIPFMISIETEPFLKATYYNMDINNSVSLDYKYLNSKVGASFSISTLSISKDISPTATNKYTLDSNVYKLSFNLNTNLSYSDLKNKVVIKCIMTDAKDSKTFGHFFFKLKDVETNTSGVVSYSYTYEAELATDYTFNSGMLNMYNCLYKNSSSSDNYRSQLYKSVPIEEDICFQIGILLYDQNLAATQTKDEKADWYYPFPVGFIQTIEDPVEIISDTSPMEFSECSELTNQSEYYSTTDNDPWKGYRSVDSVLFLPVALDNSNSSGTSGNNYQFYEDKEFDWSSNEDYLNSMGVISYFSNEHSLKDGKLSITIKDSYPVTNKDADTNHLLLNGYVKIVIPNFVFSTTDDTYYVEIGHKLYYDEAQANFGNTNDNIKITKTFDKDGYKYITFEIQSIIKITESENVDENSESYVKLISTDYSNNDPDSESPVIYRRDKEAVNMLGQLGYSILSNVDSMDRVAVMFYNVYRSTKSATGNKTIAVSTDELLVNSIVLSRTDDDVDGSANSRDEISNYVLATVINNSNTVKMYQNMSSLMSSIVTYDEDNDTYDLELVPLISLRYYMARPEMIYDILNKFIDIVDSLLPRLENNTNCDMKFYNTYGPSRYFYFNKEAITKTTYLDSETNEEVDIEADDYNPYKNTVVTTNSYTKYNYLGRTDIILDFTIYVNESITSEKDEEIKKYISDFVEQTNDELILPISNLIVSLQNNFPIIKYIKYNGIFSDIVDSNNSSKNNDYQLIDNDFDFNEMTKDEIRVYVPEYLNVKKSVIKTNEDTITYSDDIFDLLKYSTYDYVINITYKL